MASQPAEIPVWFAAATRRIGNVSLFRRDAPAENARAAIGWWETRRVSYNLVVGAAGIVTCVVVFTIGAAASIFFNSDFGMPNPPLFAVFGVILYGILANLCFTGGWVTELIVRKVWPEEADQFATTTFSLGLSFSVLLTLAPAILIGAVGFFSLVNHFLHSAHK